MWFEDECFRTFESVGNMGECFSNTGGCVVLLGGQVFLSNASAAGTIWSTTLACCLVVLCCGISWKKKATSGLPAHPDATTLPDSASCSELRRQHFVTRPACSWPSPPMSRHDLLCVLFSMMISIIQDHYLQRKSDFRVLLRCWSFGVCNRPLLRHPMME